MEIAVGPDLVAYLNMRLQSIDAEAAVIRKLLQAGAESTRATEEEIDLSKFNPDWKSGVYLSPLGKRAILAAYDKYFGVMDVAKLFNISPKAASGWRERWEQARKAQ